MKAEILALKALFQKDVRYLIPTFQRPYVWHHEEQWEPLWNDVRNVAERYLDQLSEVGDTEQARAEELTDSHFLGAVVVQQKPTPTAYIETRHVIDGQQRFITLQLLLDAAQEVFERYGRSKEARRLSRLVLNDKDYTEGNPDHAFKVWPTNVDQEAFRQAMRNEASIEGFEDALVVQAHEFFQFQIQQWLNASASDQEDRVHTLETALMGLLEMVVIDVTSADDAHVIFETLNARGTPLLASDLVKNLILQKTAESGLDSGALYAKQWRSFDDKWWREEIRQGRLVRPRIDVFLNYWLVMRTADEVPAHNVFPIFRSYVESAEQPITKVVEDIREIGGTYRELEKHDPWSPVGTFIYRWGVMDAGVATPAVLWLLSKANEIPEDSLHRSLKTIESFLVRRMLCRMTTKDYNRLFLDLVERLGAARAEVADEAAVEYLDQQTADARLWPDDNAVKEAFLALPLYRLLTRGRLRMVLEALEEKLRTPKAEEQQVKRDRLTIEHIMPQHWQEHWPLDAETKEDALQASQARDRLLHSIGNLTLVNKKLNPALSNAAWVKKRSALQGHSVLYLNKMLLDESTATWDENAIAARATRLAETASNVWPAADRI